MKVYVCNICKKEILILKDSMPTPICCGQNMTLLVPNTTDGATEKHVPVVEIEGNVLKATVGEVIHPSIEVHYIEFIALETDQGISVHYLEPGDVPQTTFTLGENEKPIAVYELCNLHGLWKKEL